MPRFSAFDLWFRPKQFESERLYERLGAPLIKRYVPTGGDIVMQRLRRNHPERRWVTSSLQSLWRYERKTRLNESIHLIGFIGFTALASRRFIAGSLTVLGFAAAMTLNLIFGLWPVVLQRYNRLRLYGLSTNARICLNACKAAAKCAGQTRMLSDSISGWESEDWHSMSQSRDKGHPAL